MPNRLALLLPLAALALVAAGAIATLAVRDGGQTSPFSAFNVTPTVAPTSPPTSPALRPSGSVCQGAMRRPDPGQPRVYPAEYSKQREALGIAVVGSAQVDDRALDAAVATIERFFKNNGLASRLAEEGAYVVVAEQSRALDELPEFACLSASVRDDVHTACGIADRADYPVVAVDELDMLGNRRGPCRGLNILYHELGHLVQGWTLAPTDYFDVRLFYQAALDAGKYKDAYAAKNVNEYFAEATQAYFLYGEPDGAHDRTWLRRYDPDLYELLARNYGD